MEMASSEVEMSSCQTFNSVLSPHERCNNNNNNKKNNNDNVRNIHVAFEKNLNVFVRDHLDNNCSISCVDRNVSTKAVPECSSVSNHRHEVPSSSSLGSDPDPIFPNPGQPDKNSSRKETMAASSLVQIWEARTTQQPSSSNQNQSQIDSRTSSSGSNMLENSESLNEESVKDSELIGPIEEGNNEEEEEEEIECDSQSVPQPPDCGEKEREGVRVMDIIRKLSYESETPINNENGSNNNDISKEGQITEARCLLQVTCPPRIRGRQAFEDLLVQMTHDREKELACLLERHSVSKFTHRGRIQSILRIRCYERCIAIQDGHRSKSSSAGSDLNRTPRGSGVNVMHLRREKYKTKSENTQAGALFSSVSSRGRLLDKDHHKASEKKVLQETIEKIDLKETQEVISAVEKMKKAVSSETAENKCGVKKSAGETIKKETVEERGEKREVKEKAVAKQSLEGRVEKRETNEKVVAQKCLEGRGEKQETKEKNVAKLSDQGIGERRETKEKAVSKEILEGTLIKEKAIAKENVEGNVPIGIAEKVNLWKSEEKMYKRKGIEKGKTESRGNTERVEKNDVLEEATRRIINVESAERSITTSKDTTRPCEFAEKVVVRIKNKEDCVSLETKSKETEEVTSQAHTWLRESTSEEKVLPETILKSDLKRPIEKESSEGVEENTLMGIAEKVNMWNSKDKENKRRAMEQGKGKTEGKTNTKTDEILQEASRRMINVETAERSITNSKEKVVVNTEMMDRREESSREITRCESEEKERIKKDGDFACVEAKSKEVIEVKNMNPQEVITADNEIDSSQHSEEMSILRNPKAKSTKEIDRNNFQEIIVEEAEYASEGSREKAKENNSSKQDEELEDGETKKEEDKEKEKTTEFLNDWDEDEDEEEDCGDYDHYNGDYTYDWFSDISRPRSYWEDLRKERYLEVLNTNSEKKDICNLIERRTVSNFLTSDLRQKIDNLMITRVQNHLGVKINREVEKEEEVWVEECSARNLEGNETEEESENTNVEDTSDVCSQSSPRSSTLMMSWSFRDQEIDKVQEPTTSLSLLPDPPISTNQSETQMISDLRGQMEQLQREVMELRNSVKSCIDMQIHFQKSVTQDLTHSGSSSEQRVETRNNPLKRKCCVCLEMPVDSLLYRCGHMCTCLKCAHELQWSSKKCPICLAPIVDVVRAFLDS